MPAFGLVHHPRIQPWKLAIVLGFVVMGGYLLLRDPLARDLLANFWSTFVAALVVAGVIVHKPARRAPWLLFAIGLGLLAVGDWTWTLLTHAGGGEPAVPSVTDAFTLMGELVMAVGVLGILRNRLPGSDRASLLDALILAVGFGVVCWVWFMGPMAGARSSGVELGVTLAYPIIDVALLGILGRLAMTPGPRVMSDRLLLLGMAAFLVGDLGFAWLDSQGLYVEGGLVDVAFLIALQAFAAAALHPSMKTYVPRGETPAVGLSTSRMLVLAGATLLSPAVLFLQASVDRQVDVPIIAIGTLLLFSLVLARLFLAVSELRRTLGERQKLEAELKRQALHDPLTGLANRVLFADRLEHALSRRRELVAVLYLDLDDFKTVNDTLGHEAGDVLLARTAERLRATVRSHDTAARLGGDEFAVLLEDSPDLRVAAAIAERLLAALSTPVEIQGRLVVIRASIGISLGVAGQTDAPSMMREADIAMYLAKGQGKGRYAVFEPTMHLNVVRGFELRSDLEHAAARGQLRLDYQPIVSLVTGRPAGVEALLRWEHPERGLLPPLDFVPLAEATGLILPIGRWVIDEACRTLARLAPAIGIPDLRMNINVSPVQLNDPLLVPAVERAIAEHGISPGALILELTETAVPDPDVAARMLTALRAVGVRLAIDDFGSGYSSLGHLGRMPVDILKLDRTFIQSLNADDRSEALAAGIIALSRSLGLQVVAEGIERQEQLEVLRRLSCELGQGNWLAPAMREEELVAEMTEGHGPSEVRRFVLGAVSAFAPLR
jgi:diguanylate cyclase (GGDEF)-like protein